MAAHLAGAQGPGREPELLEQWPMDTSVGSSFASADEGSVWMEVEAADEPAAEPGPRDSGGWALQRAALAQLGGGGGDVRTLALRPEPETGLALAPRGGARERERLPWIRCADWFGGASRTPLEPVLAAPPPPPPSPQPPAKPSTPSTAWPAPADGRSPLTELGARCPSLLRRILVAAGATDIGRYWRWSIVQEGQGDLCRDNKDRRMLHWKCLSEESRDLFAAAFQKAFGEWSALFGLLVDDSLPQSHAWWSCTLAPKSRANATITHSGLPAPSAAASAPPVPETCAGPADMPPPLFLPREAVAISGLVSERGQQLNGLQAVVLRHVAERGRFEVEVLRDGQVVSLRPANLLRRLDSRVRPPSLPE